MPSYLSFCLFLFRLYQLTVYVAFLNTAIRVCSVPLLRLLQQPPSPRSVHSTLALVHTDSHYFYVVQ